MRTAINDGLVTADYLIERLGGTYRVANILGIKSPSVSDWKKGNSIPDDKLIRLANEIELVSGGVIGRKVLFPEDWMSIWPELAESDKCACRS